MTATLLVVTPTRDETVDRLEAAFESVTVVESVREVDQAIDPAVDCVVTRHDLPDGTGFDVHECVSRVAPSVPVVLVAEPTGEVAASAVERSVAGFVPLEAGIPDERLLETVQKALDGNVPHAGVPADDDQSLVEWKADVLDQLLARAPVHLYVKDAEARHVLVSRAHVEDAEDVLGSTDLETGLVPAGEARNSYDDDLRLLESGESIVDNEEYYPSTGEWYLTSKVPRYGEDGTITGIIGVSREITDRKEAQRQLEALNERLEQFVSVVSHDLRNPLNVAQGRVELERRERDSEHLATAVRAHERMEALIEDLLTLAREGGDHDESDYDPLSLSALAERSWADVATSDADLTVVDEFAFSGVGGRVQQLFENLFRNSVEHSSTSSRIQSDDGVEHGSTTDDSVEDDPSTVSVRVGALPDDDGFYVEDDGPGVPESERESVFESGYSTNPSGTGFGLAIVEDVVDEHGWDVRVTSADTGGARFEVTGVDRRS